jgi:hypothetical protein
MRAARPRSSRPSTRDRRGFGTLTAGATDALRTLDGLTFPGRGRAGRLAAARALLLGKLSEALAHSGSDTSWSRATGRGWPRRTLCHCRGPSRGWPPWWPPRMPGWRAGSSRCCWTHAGPSGAAAGPFRHADPNCTGGSSGTCAEEVEPDAVFAEVVHLPEGRLGNILARPVLALRDPLPRRAAVPARQILVTDLFGRHARGSSPPARLGRRSPPDQRHNYEMSQGIYPFLRAAVAGCGRPGLGLGPVATRRFCPAWCPAGWCWARELAGRRGRVESARPGPARQLPPGPAPRRGDAALGRPRRGGQRAADRPDNAWRSIRSSSWSRAKAGQAGRAVPAPDQLCAAAPRADSSTSWWCRSTPFHGHRRLACR